MSPDTSDDSDYFGIWPAVVGYLCAIAIVASMFALATGMV